METQVGNAGPAVRAALAPSNSGIGSLPFLPSGSVLAERYEILESLGQGGMGAVYKVYDRELDRVVALKTIRPELAGNPEILRRFKQELILARQVAHRNIVRLYDISDGSGVKFITMEYVDGEDFRSILLREGRLSPEQAVQVIRQICLALEAAHSEGVVHRDLKPQNIMRDKQGRIVVMDFGLARALESGGMTQTGVLIGTMEYMAPEQAKGGVVGPTSDIYAAGLVFYELLTGRMPYEAESALASLMKRAQQRAVPASDHDKSIPRHLSAIVGRCIEPDPRQRYQSAVELLHDLEVFQPSGLSSISTLGARRSEVRIAYKQLAVAIVVLLVVGAALFGWRRLANKPQVQHAPVTVLVADFTNHTGDPIFDGTLEPMFNIALEGANFVNAYNRGQARRLARQLPDHTGTLDEEAARLIAVGQGIDAVITGSLSQRGDGYKLSAEAIDARTGNTVASTDVTAANKDEVMLAIPKLVAPIRKALGDTTPESVQLTAEGGPFQTPSLEAVHQYGIAMEQEFAGNVEGALQSFRKVTELDPNFARAYAGMAGGYRNLGQRDQAEQYFKLAMQHVDHMTQRERYRTRGAYYATTANYKQCIDEYTALVKEYPADNIGHNNLAICYGRLKNLRKAVEEARQAVAINPKALMQRMNYSLYSSYAGDFETGEREARTALQLSPSEYAYLALAYGQLGQGRLSDAADTYRQLEKVSAKGSSFAASGLADLAIYEGRFAEAAKILKQGAAADFASKMPDRAAAKLATLAYIQLLRGEKQAALASLQTALADSRAIKLRFFVARLYAAAGEAAKAKALAAELGSDLQAENQVYAKIIEADIALQQNDDRQAIQLLTEANGLIDTWIGRFDLGRALLQAGMFTEANAEFDRCVKRRGETMELFVDDVPTYGYFPVVYYYSGRVLEGLKSAGFADAYRSYLDIRGKAGEDPLLAEIRRRIGR